jgi:hypothetical protein
MASRVKELAGHLIGRKLTDAGAHLYHAADGVSDGGVYTGAQTHKIRKALHRMRLRASGMTDDLMGSKETQGTMDNPYEKSPAHR